MSSDSPTPSLKRDSSDLSIGGEAFLHGSKRQRKLPSDEKENVLKDSAKVNVVPDMQRIVSRDANDGMKWGQLNSDLFAVSLKNTAKGKT